MSVPASSVAFQVVNPPNTKPKEPKKVAFNKPTVKGVIRNDNGGVHRYVLDNDKVDRDDWGKFTPLSNASALANIDRDSTAKNKAIALQQDKGPVMLANNPDLSNLTMDKDGVNYTRIGDSWVRTAILPENHGQRIEDIDRTYGDIRYINNLQKKQEVPMYYYINKQREDLWNKYNDALQKQDYYNAAMYRKTLNTFDTNVYNNYYPRAFEEAAKNGFGTVADNRFYLATGARLSDYLSTNPVQITPAMLNIASAKQIARNTGLAAAGASMSGVTATVYGAPLGRAASFTNAAYNWWSLGKSIYLKGKAAALSAEGRHEEAAITMKAALEAEIAENATSVIAAGDLLGLGIPKILGSKIVSPIAKRVAPRAASYMAATSRAMAPKAALPSVIQTVVTASDTAGTVLDMVNPFIKDNPYPAKILDSAVKDRQKQTDPNKQNMLDRAAEGMEALKSGIAAEASNKKIDDIKAARSPEEAVKAIQESDAIDYSAYLTELEKLKKINGYTADKGIELANNKLFRTGRVPKEFYSSPEWLNATPQQRSMLGNTLGKSQIMASNAPEKNINNVLGTLLGTGKLGIQFALDPYKSANTYWDKNYYLREQMTLFIKNLPSSDFFENNAGGNKVATAFFGRVAKDDPIWAGNVLIKGLKYSAIKGKTQGFSNDVSPELRETLSTVVNKINVIYNKAGKKGITAYLNENINSKEFADIGLAVLASANGGSKGNSFLDPATAKLVSESYEEMVHMKVKDDPLNNLPGAMALFAAKHGYGDLAKFLKSPLNFYITAGLLLFGTGVVGASMLGLFGNKDSRGTEDSTIDDDAIAYKRRMRRRYSNSMYNNIFENYRGFQRNV